MAVRDILIWPNPKLTEGAFPVGGSVQYLRTLRNPLSWRERVVDGQRVRELVQDLADTMRDRDGAGIAAPQIGVPVGIFLVAPFVAGNEGADPLVFINPEVTWVSEETSREKEGCLSFPDIWIFIERPAQCRMRAIDVDGKGFEVEAEGLYARALQHEYDHLNGTLMTDFVGQLKKDMIRKKLKKQLKAKSKKKRR